mgnify:CR=1 FL=1
MRSQAGVGEGLAGRGREATARDLDRVAALWSAITDHHAPLDPLFRMRPEAGGELRELLGGLCRNPDAAIFVYEEAGDLPGMCIVRIDRSPPILEETRRAEITDIGVREDHRRQGIASQLVSYAGTYAFKEMNVQRLVISSDRDSSASRQSHGD